MSNWLAQFGGKGVAAMRACNVDTVQEQAKLSGGDTRNTITDSERLIETGRVP